MPLATGYVLNNRYRIVRLLRQGGFGAVYRAWDTHLKRPVALKENLETTDAAKSQFLREARMLAGLAHPNLPRVTDHFLLQDQGQYLVMDFVEGRDLDELLEERGEPLSESEVMPWVLQVCDALDYLHAQRPPVIHRDIKPANIKITPTGQVKLVDFGIAKFYDPHLKTTRGARAVTPGFSPHEQYGQGKTDERTDIYALGATLYALLTGRYPPESVQRIPHDTLQTTRVVNPKISIGLDEAVSRAMQVDPGMRFQRISDFKSALLGKGPDLAHSPEDKQGVEGRSTSVQSMSSDSAAYRGDTFVTPPAKPPRREPGAGPMLGKGLLMRGGLVFLGVFLIGLLAIFVFYSMLDGGTDPLQSTATSLARTLMAIGSSPSEATESESPTDTPDNFDEDRNAQLTATSQAAILMMTETAIALTENAPPPVTVAIPPTETPSTAPTVVSETKGEWIAYAFGEKQYRRDLYMKNFLTGVERSLLTGGAGVNGPSFSPDGRKIAFMGCRDDVGCEIYVLDLSTQVEQKLTEVDGDAMFPHWCRNPSRPWIVFENRPERYKNYVSMVNLDNSEIQRLTTTGADSRPSWSPDCRQIVFGRATSDTDGNGIVSSSDFLDIHLLDVDTLEVSRLTNTPGEDEFNFAWSPNGERIAFCRVSSDTNGDGAINLNDHSDLFLVNPDGSGETNLTRGLHSAFSPSWSPDSQQIVFSAYDQDASKQVLWIYSLVTGEFTPLTGQDYYYHPGWSP